MYLHICIYVKVQMHSHICECIHAHTDIFISVCLHFYNCISLFTKLGYTKLSMTLTIKRISHTPFMSVVCFTSFFLNGSIIFHRKHTPSFFHPVPYCCIFMFSSFFFFLFLFHFCCVHVGALFSAGNLEVELLMMAFV